jgi:hypothetical protein
LGRLMRRGLLHQYNARCAEVYGRVLYAPSAAGARELTGAAISTTRLAWLILLVERVVKVQSVAIWLAQRAAEWEWRLRDFDVEVALPFVLPGRDEQTWIPVHGAARLARADGRWATVGLEFDTLAAPVDAERERLTRWVEAQSDPRFIGPHHEDAFPILVIIARDEFRLQDYYTLLRSAAAARRLPLPPAYLATADRAWALRSNPAAPVWYSTISNRTQVPLLSDAPGHAVTPPPPVPWQQLPLGRAGQNAGAEIASLPKDAAPAFTTLRGLAALALSLTPQDKQMLDEVARHPLLSAAELALLLQASRWRTENTLARLARWKLIEPRHAAAPAEPDRPRPTPRYLLGSNGVRYLTAEAGFGEAAARYARARGWGRGFETLTRHWEHTRAENALFLEFARLAKERHHTFTWLSELESRLYYEYGNLGGQRRQSFLPDGRGTYLAGDTRYEFAVEIDRTRAGAAKFRRKLSAYYAVVTSKILRDDTSALLRVLVVTGSWERATTLCQTALALARELKAERDPLPLWVTTFDLLRVKGADAPIWIGAHTAHDAALTRALDLPRTYCFECFRPVPPQPREHVGPPRYISG